MEVEAGRYPAKKRGRCTRLLLLLISTLMMLVGFAIFGLGVYLYVADSDIIAGVNLIALVLAIGFLLFLFGSIGFCGSYGRSMCCLCLYSVLMFLIIAGEIALVIMITMKMFDVDEFLEERWSELDNDSRITVQDNFDCCGYPDFNEAIGSPCPTLEDDIGCREGLEDYITDILLYIKIAGGVVAFFEILIFVLGCCLVNSIRKDKKEY